MSRGYSELRNQLVCAADGVDYAYRDTGGLRQRVPLVLLQHFRGNLDNWAPGADRRAGPSPSGHHVRQRRSGRLHGTTPDTIEQMPATPSR